MNQNELNSEIKELLLETTCFSTETCEWIAYNVIDKKRLVERVSKTQMKNYSANKLPWESKKVDHNKNIFYIPAIVPLYSCLPSIHNERIVGQSASQAVLKDVKSLDYLPLDKIQEKPEYQELLIDFNLFENDSEENIKILGKMYRNARNLILNMQRKTTKLDSQIKKEGINEPIWVSPSTINLNGQSYSAFFAHDGSSRLSMCYNTHATKKMLTEEAEIFALLMNNENKINYHNTVSNKKVSESIKNTFKIPVKIILSDQHNRKALECARLIKDSIHIQKELSWSTSSQADSQVKHILDEFKKQNLLEESNEKRFLGDEILPRNDYPDYVIADFFLSLTPSDKISTTERHYIENRRQIISNILHKESNREDKITINDIAKLAARIGSNYIAIKNDQGKIIRKFNTIFADLERAFKTGTVMVTGYKHPRLNWKNTKRSPQELYEAALKNLEVAEAKYQEANKYSRKSEEVNKKNTDLKRKIIEENCPDLLELGFKAMYYAAGYGLLATVESKEGVVDTTNSAPHFRKILLSDDPKYCLQILANIITHYRKSYDSFIEGSKDFYVDSLPLAPNYKNEEDTMELNIIRETSKKYKGGNLYFGVDYEVDNSLSKRLNDFYQSMKELEQDWESAMHQDDFEGVDEGRFNSSTLQSITLIASNWMSVINSNNETYQKNHNIPDKVIDSTRSNLEYGDSTQDYNYEQVEEEILGYIKVSNCFTNNNEFITLSYDQNLDRFNSDIFISQLGPDYTHQLYLFVNNQNHVYYIGETDQKDIVRYREHKNSQDGPSFACLKEIRVLPVIPNNYSEADTKQKVKQTEKKFIQKYTPSSNKQYK